VAQTPGGVRIEGEMPEVWGSASFEQLVDERWIFALRRQEFGWSIAIYDANDATRSVDLSVVTPPYGGAPNERDLFGWHVRSADNTGPNEGDVNAPQWERTFLFTTSVETARAFGPSTNENEPRFAEPDTTQGRGWLRIVDSGLADLSPGGRARFTYLRFEACLSWPKSAEEKRAEADAASPEYLPEEIETIAACGLDLATYELHAQFLPRMVSGDLDGDGTLDSFAQIRRRSDGKRGLVMCRSGSALHVLGMDGRSIGEEIPAGYLEQLEAWSLLPRDHGPLGYIGERAWPDCAGEVLVLERIEKEMRLLYWQEGAFHSREVYRFVEP
jgi:hypothetical protein